MRVKICAACETNHLDQYEGRGAEADVLDDVGLADEIEVEQPLQDVCFFR
jgi:hypothetical protein